MNLAAVESTTLTAVGFDDRLGVLQLVFRSGAIYQYFGVSSEMHEELLGASSKGSYFNRVIRGHFPFCLVIHTEPGTEKPAEGAR